LLWSLASAEISFGKLSMDALFNLLQQLRIPLWTKMNVVQ
jgi:hypothetical protein